MGRAFGARPSDKEVGSGVRCNERWGNREIPLALIHQACPSLAEFCGIVSSQTDIIEAGKTLRPSFGASPDAWNEGVRLIGLSGRNPLDLCPPACLRRRTKKWSARKRNPWKIWGRFQIFDPAHR